MQKKNKYPLCILHEFFYFIVNKIINARCIDEMESGDFLKFRRIKRFAEYIKQSLILYIFGFLFLYCIKCRVAIATNDK